MGRRTAVPLFKDRHVAFLKGIREIDNIDKALAGHLQLGTGARAYSISHTHSSWFVYDEDDLYYRIPMSDLCRKNGDTEPCGDCNMYNRGTYRARKLV